MKKISQTNKILFILILMCNINISGLYSQNIAITDDDTYTAANSAMLDVKSTSKGLLIPRLTTLQRGTINSAATGLLVFDIDKNAFYYYDGTEWLALPQVSSSTAVSDALFAVKNSAGDTIFAVYNDGVKVVVPYGTKGKVGGFAVSGRSPTKAGEEEYLLVTPDSTRVFVNEVDVKGKVGGFAVSGRSPTKTVIKDYFISTLDSTRIYVLEGSNKGKVGGFAVSGRSPTKLSETNDYFNISGNLLAEIIKNESRVMWYPVKAALLAGEVHVGSADSVGTNSTSLGYRTIAMGNYSQAMGFMAQSLGLNSTAIGNNAVAKLTNSFAFGDSAQSLNIDAYAFGAGAIASGIGSYAFGSMGRDTVSFEPTSLPTIAEGDYSFAIGQGAYAKGKISTSIGNNTTAEGKNSLALGSNTIARGDYSTAIGNKSIASGNYGTAMGYSTTASNNYSTAMGANTTASGGNSLAAGAWTIASGALSIATGYSNTSSGYISFTLGKDNQASGDYSIAAGYGAAIASGDNTVAIGEGAVAQAYSSFVIGRYNVVEGNMTEWITTDPLFVIGYGQSHSKANAVTVLKNGYVGIGINPPTQKLDINGQVRIRGGSPGANKVLTSDIDGVGSWITMDISNTSGTLTVSRGGTGLTALTANKILVGNGSSSILNPTNLHWDNTNSRLGIGTVLPQNNLHISNSVSEAMLLQRSSTTPTHTTGILFKVSTNTANEQFKGGIFYELTSAAGVGRLHFAINGLTDNTNASLSDAKMTIANNGYVGINDISPSYNFDVNGTGRFVNDVYLATSSGNVCIGNTSTTYKLDVTGTTRSSLSAYFATSSGNVGIGTTNTGSYKLNVLSSTGGGTAASGFFNNTATNGLALRAETESSDGTALFIQKSTGYSVRCDGYDPDYFVAMIVKGRNVGINTSTPTQNLDVNGNARFRVIGSGAYSGVVNRTSDGTLTTATSDVRLKENITTLNNSLSKVIQLRGVNFTWKSEPQMGNRVGFIAQEVEEILPELVFTNEVDGYKGVNYAEMSAVLVEALKEQQNMIANLKSENSQLKSDYQNLKQEIENIKKQLELSSEK